MQRQRRKSVGIVSFAATEQGMYRTYPWGKRHPAKVLNDAARDGIYNPKAVALSLQHPPHTIASLPSISPKLQSEVELNDGVHIQGWAIIPGMGTSNQTIFVILKNGERTVEIPTTRRERPDVCKQYGVSFLYYYSGYDAYLAA